jgi:hypothetical protein
VTHDADAAALLELFHTQVRLHDRDAAPGFVVDRDGPVHRTYPPDAGEHGAMVECPEGLGDDPDHWVARQLEFFTTRGQVVEWKTYGYDEPTDLPERPPTAGFVADDPEVVSRPRPRLPLRARRHLTGLPTHPHRARDARGRRHPALRARPRPGCGGTRFADPVTERADAHFGCRVPPTAG